MTGPPPPRRPPGRRLAGWAAGLLVAVPTLTTGCRLLDTDALTPVPQALSFLPWLILPAALALLLALAARERLLAGWAALVLGATAWCVLPHGPATTTARGPVVARLRVLAANVEFGQATGDLAAAVRRERPHLVHVCECDRSCVRTLTAALGASHPYRAVVDGAGSAGSVILSALPLTARPAIPAAMGMPGATARIGGRDVELRLAHPLPPLPGQVDLWKSELGRLERFAAEHGDSGPVLLAGDFNASQDHAAFRSVLAAGRLHDAARLAGAARTPTWPREGPLPPYVQIDHVLVSDDFRVHGVRFLDLAGTDHRAVLAELDLHAGR
ncbi:endonuclease/exonuclease/phosphatase family protein [Streptomyces sp. ISL-36]|uniref:endonuclease/exonuclease/phosphatase family protein n=1 Tax=Streptomyces sp. ISL-36 TaxID=2819182 RepID=UPI001BE8A951|nr:endonuclease/exonuclease/phosphatase family protein [Streptomyces sp. ISL-36]MBT2444378.1 endonuclease/exonuclease/phosphatase family protein [Streptomyces sp. ISL-36]